MYFNAKHSFHLQVHIYVFLCTVLYVDLVSSISLSLWTPCDSTGTLLDHCWRRNHISYEPIKWEKNVQIIFLQLSSWTPQRQVGNEFAQPTSSPRIMDIFLRTWCRLIIVRYLILFTNVLSIVSVLKFSQDILIQLGKGQEKYILPYRPSMDQSNFPWFWQNTKTSKEVLLAATWLNLAHEQHNFIF